MATIKDIAERAGVSRGTVDRVLNGRGEVSRDTKARVLFAVKELDYHPNKAGIALAAQKKPAASRPRQKRPPSTAVRSSSSASPLT